MRHLSLIGRRLAGGMGTQGLHSICASKLILCNPPLYRSKEFWKIGENYLQILKHEPDSTMNTV